MQGQHSKQSSFFGMIYEDLIPQDHLLCQVAAAVDFGFVSDLVSDCYCPDNERPSWDPLVLFKVVFLQFLYDLSDREIEEQVNFHLVRKWFAGLGPEEHAPDHSTLSRFRSRLGPEKFQQIFNEIITQTREAGLVSDRLQIIDATHLQAKVDLFRLPDPPADTPAAQAPGSPDPDARFGRKSPNKGFYGYKEHMGLDPDSELVTAVRVTPGNVADCQMLDPLIDLHTQEVTADKGYDTDANHCQLKDNGQRSSIIVKANRTNPEVIGQANPKSQRERPIIERKFAEQKKYHGLAKARYWGLARVTIQVLMTCLVVNAKKIAKLVNNGLSRPSSRLAGSYT